MIKRYTDPRIVRTWDLGRKYELWQKTEQAVILARERLNEVPIGTAATIAKCLEVPIDATFIDEREKILNHDLNAFIDERLRHLPRELTKFFHQGMTSYDTEEPAFATMLKESTGEVVADTRELQQAIRVLALRYRFTPMNGRTHGQEAEMMSFGKRCATWYQDLVIAFDAFQQTLVNLQWSKLSGAIGTNAGIHPTLEAEALSILGFEAWAGATQIMPRILYAPIADALANLAQVIDKIALDVRLGSRSGRPLWHEPFGKGQKGSSAMPHKKNNILCENIAGMAIMASGYAAMIRQTIKTWEERAIEQSSVERVAWPDLFHVVLRAIKNLTKVMSGLVVYPDNMAIEIVESRGTYGSNRAKEVLADLGVLHDIDRETAYRIVQLACFNVFEPSEVAQELRKSPPGELETSGVPALEIIRWGGRTYAQMMSIDRVISQGKLRVSPELAADEETVREWNKKLADLFESGLPGLLKKWDDVFDSERILANEAYLFQQIFKE